MGSSSSTASTNTTIDQTISNVDNRVGGGDGGVIGGNLNLTLGTSNELGGDLTISQTDHGSVAGGLSVAMAALDNIGEAQALNAEQNAVRDHQASEAVTKALNLAGETSRSEAGMALDSFTKTGAMALVAVAALFVAYKKFN